MIVVDASAVGAFLLPDEASPFADFARDLCAREPLHAPAHWAVEIASLIRKAERRGRLTADQTRSAAAVADSIAANLTIAAVPQIADLVSECAALGLSTYDAPYLILARRMKARLLTGDDQLARAASASGVDVLTP